MFALLLKHFRHVLDHDAEVISRRLPFVQDQCERCWGWRSVHNKQRGPSEPPQATDWILRLITLTLLAALQKKKGPANRPLLKSTEFQASMRYFVKQAESSITPGQSAGTNVSQ